MSQQARTFLSFRTIGEAPADSPLPSAEMQTAEAAAPMAAVNSLPPNDTPATQQAAVVPGNEL